MGMFVACHSLVYCRKLPFFFFFLPFQRYTCLFTQIVHYCCNKCCFLQLFFYLEQHRCDFREQASLLQIEEAVCKLSFYFEFAVNSWWGAAALYKGFCSTVLPKCYSDLHEPFRLFSTRSPAERRSSKGIHLRHVSQPQSNWEKNHLLPLHLCHRHGQHSICLPGGEGPLLAGQPGRLQLGLKLL